MMILDEFLNSKNPPDKIELNNDDLVKFFWKYKGNQKKWDRANNFWSATNENLKIAYEKLDEKEQELESAYSIIREDLSVGSKIQAALLPKMTPQMEKDIECAVYHKQLAEVGGDYYDFFNTVNNSYAMGIFDISGHGVSAALVMTYLKAQFMQVMDRLDSPKEIVEAVNNVSFDFLKGVKKYATVNLVVFAPDKIKYVCGGGFGVLIRNNEPQFFNKKDHFLGLRNKPFSEYELPFEKNDILVIYTDGIVESQNAKKEDYTVKRLNDLIIRNSDKPVADILSICLQDYRSFTDKDFDDITLLILRKK